jgi:hypothetical protein
MLNLWKLLTLSVRMCTFAGGGDYLVVVVMAVARLNNYRYTRMVKALCNLWIR